MSEQQIVDKRVGSPDFYEGIGNGAPPPYLRKSHWYIKLMQLRERRVPNMLATIRFIIEADLKWRCGYHDGRMGYLKDICRAIREFGAVLTYFGHGKEYMTLLEHATMVYGGLMKHITKFKQDYAFLNPRYDYGEGGQPCRAVRKHLDPVLYLDMCYVIRKDGHLQPLNGLKYKSRLETLETIFSSIDMMKFAKRHKEGPEDYKVFRETALYDRFCRLVG